MGVGSPYLLVNSPLGALEEVTPALFGTRMRTLRIKKPYVKNS